MIYCQKCGNKNPNDAVFCNKCGNSIKKNATGDVEYKRLYRSDYDKLIGGVCGGIAEYFKIDPILVRVIFFIGLFFSFGFFIPIYILFWIFVRKNPNHT
jgi:phage shock protein PspC (stress-responsive transcriptional regulator)